MAIDVAAYEVELETLMAKTRTMVAEMEAFMSKINAAEGLARQAMTQTKQHEEM